MKISMIFRESLDLNGVNCKGKDVRVEKTANVGNWILRECLFMFTWNTIIIRNGSLGT